MFQIWAYDAIWALLQITVMILQVPFSECLLSARSFASLSHSGPYHVAWLIFIFSLSEMRKVTLRWITYVRQVKVLWNHTQSQLQSLCFFHCLHKPQTWANTKTHIGWPSLGQSSERILDYMDYDDGSYWILGPAPAQDYNWRVSFQGWKCLIDVGILYNIWQSALYK